MVTGFTKLQRMVLGLALLLGFGQVWSQCDIPAPDGAYYNMQFENGMVDPNGGVWENLDGSLSPADVGWTYDEEGRVDMGNFNSNVPTILSPSQCNGAVVFDSDFLDNGGTGVFGSGDCPAPCRRILQSPNIDLSMADGDIVFEFFQVYRNFTSTVNVFFSNDGGITFFDTLVHTPSASNFLYPTNMPFVQEFVRHPICDYEPSSEFVVRFDMSANYYVLGIDDISIVAGGYRDIAVDRDWYTVAPAFSTPVNMTSEYPLMADLGNYGTVDATGVEQTVSITNADGAEVYSNSQVFPTVLTCGDSTQLYENTSFDPYYAPELEEGAYEVFYSVDTTGDRYLANNAIRAGDFRITERDFQVLPLEREYSLNFNYLVGINEAQVNQTWGCMYYIPQNEGGQGIQSVTFGMEFDQQVNGGEIAEGFIRVAVYEWIDLDEDNTIDGDERILLGDTEFLVIEGAFENWREVSVQPLDENGQTIIPNGDSQILVAVHTRPVNADQFNWEILTEFLNPNDREFWYLPIISQWETDARPTRYSTLYSRGAAGTAEDEDTRDLFLYNNVSSLVNMQLTPPSSVEDEIVDLGISAYPSPANTVVNLDFALEGLSQEVNVEFVNAAGQSVRIVELENVQRGTESIDVSDMPTGMYVLNIRTDFGTDTQKVMIVK